MPYFENLIGNEKIKQELTETMENQTNSHSYMFVGKSGIGKRLFAREFAKGLLGDFNKDILNYEDYKEIGPLEGKKIISVDQIREIIKEANELPTESEKRVFVIDEADKMNSEAQNSILKTLEEPPEYVVIILIVTNESKMLETIKSRCNIIKFDTLKESEIEKYLIKENLLDKSRKNVEIKLLNGSLENVNNLDSMLENYDYLKVLVSYIKKKDIIQALNNGLLLYESKDDIINLLDLLNIVFLEERLTKCVFVVENTKTKILQNNNYNMCIDNLIMKSIDSI